MQKAFDPGWSEECVSIYRHYAIYHQSEAGAEQAVFDSVSGESATRSARVIKGLAMANLLRGPGRLIDVGCGNGAFLRAMSFAMPGWSLAGAETDEKYKCMVEAIPGVERLYTASPSDLPCDFDVITMIHALEHIPDPVAFLATLRPKLLARGMLVVEVPDCLQNPFDLLVADHATHFTLATLRQTIEAAGYEVVVSTDNWVPKELTVVGRPHAARAAAAWLGNAGHPLDLAARHVSWLNKVVEAVRTARREAGIPDRFGLFGTSIAATWLANELSGSVGFFVDEDPSRQRHEFTGRPVYDPSEIPDRAQVYLGLAPSVARTVAARLRVTAPKMTFYEPPSLDV